MTQPSKSGAVFLILFGAVFAGFGIFATTTFYISDPTKVKGNPMVGLVISGIFILIGFAIMAAAVFGNRLVKDQYARQQNSPDSPWLWRKDWAESRAESKNRNSAVGLWIAAGLVDMISAVIAAAVIPKFLSDGNPATLVPLVFFVFGIILTVFAVRATIRRERFGQTYFDFTSLPFSPGRALKGSIHLRFTTDAPHGIDLKLACFRQVTTGSGNNRSTQKIVLWETTKNVPAQSLTPGPMGDAVIPVEFMIPSDAYETNHEQLSDQVIWMLHAKADVPGVDYADDFEVPVFRLTPGTPAPDNKSDSASAVAGPSFLTDSSDVAAPENPKVVVSTGFHGGTEYYFPPFRNPLMVFTLLVITTILGAVVYFLHRSTAPGIFPVVFGLFHLLLLGALVHVALGSFRIEVASDRLFLRRALLGIGKTSEVLFSNIAMIQTTQSGQNSGGSSSSFAIRLLTKDGKRVTLADSISNRDEARWVVAQLEKFAGLKLDTHVTIEAVGMATAPPQRGQGYPNTANMQRPAAALAIGIAMFMGMAGFFAFRMAARPRPANRGINRKTTSRTQPVQRISYAPMTDKDEDRLKTLSEQAQAEELMERAIQHDQRALDLFEQNIGIWLGDIKLTDNMKQLEQRSRFSSDLRVRYANADLNLAMDGWAKTENSADLLVAKAQSDLGYRQAAVYFMGMMAGRGVGYAQIYPELVRFATSDRDPNVRVWAVEGMRYLGSDEALEELFEIFTHDPSTQVRNRAGCNISDCGNFMRKQRMKMVPKLIELAADEQTSAQMRNWSFMALREITDESLPSTASAWQDWYEKHGADKRAEFEQMDWWKVRGDE